jgi:CheY-like chemotaxis protein
MTAPVLLMLEDNAERLERFQAAAVRLGVDLTSWPNAHAMIEEVERFLPAACLISLDHDLEPTDDTDPGDGLDVARHLATRGPRCPVIIHTSNGIRGDAMVGELERTGWTLHRVAPLGDDWIEVDWFTVVKRALRKRRKPA